MKAKEWLQKKGIHPTEPIYWDTGERSISLDELLDEYAKFTSDNSDYAVQRKSCPGCNQIATVECLYSRLHTGNC